MTLRKKIVLLNILTVILPIVLILAVWAGYIHWGNGAGLKPINRSEDHGDLLTEAMNILYTYETEMSQMNYTDGRSVIGYDVFIKRQEDYHDENSERSIGAIRRLSGYASLLR